MEEHSAQDVREDKVRRGKNKERRGKTENEGESDHTITGISVFNWC